MKWEYEIVYIDARYPSESWMPEDVNIKFDEFGREGWELIKVVPKLKGGFYAFFMGWITLTVGYTAYFKRPLEEN